MITKIRVEFNDIYGLNSHRAFFGYKEFEKYLTRWNHELTTFHIISIQEINLESL